MIYNPRSPNDRFYWTVCRLQNGRYIELHYWYVDKNLSLLAYTNGGWCYASSTKRLYVEQGIRYESVIGNEHSDLQEVPRKAAAKYYRSQARRACKAGYDFDVLYALFMEQYHNEVLK